MTDRIRFHLDESVDPAVADGLRRRGIEATSARDVGLLKASDPRQIAFAISESRTLVTHDGDFLRLARQGIEHTGIAYCRAQALSIGQIVAALMLIHDCLTPEEMRNHVEFL